MLKEFKNIIGYEDVKIELERIIDMMVHQENFDCLGVTTTRGLLLEGDPGVGKTTMAKDFIKASKRKAFTIRKDATNENFIKLITETFSKAKENQPSIIFLDDIDKFSNEDERHCNSDEFVTIQSCIDDCHGCEVFVLATANETDCLPKSLLRTGRFDKRITVSNPTGDDARLICEYYLKKKKISKDINFEDVARFLDGGSCSDLETVINEAGVYAGFEKRKEISMDDIIRAFLRVVYQTPESLDEEERKSIDILAAHEAGHAVVSEVLRPNSVTVVTVKKHSNNSVGGFTYLLQEDDDVLFKGSDYYENETMIDLAGKAAVELMFCINDTGCGSDLTQAYNNISTMIDNLSTLGFTYRGYRNRWDDCDEVNSKTFVVTAEMERYYQATKKILFDNMELLKSMSNRLVKKHTITFKDIDELKEKYPIK